MFRSLFFFYTLHYLMPISVRGAMFLNSLSSITSDPNTLDISNFTKAIHSGNIIDLQLSSDKSVDEIAFIIHRDIGTNIINNPTLLGLSITQGPLIFSIMNEHIEMMKVLVKAGADMLKIYPSPSLNALHVACRIGNVDIVRFLIDELKMRFLIDELTPEFEPISKPDMWINESPLQTAMEANQISIIEILLQHIPITLADINYAMKFAISVGSVTIETFNFLVNKFQLLEAGPGLYLKYRWNINESKITVSHLPYYTYTMTLLEYALYCKKIDFARYLLYKGAIGEWFYYEEDNIIKKKDIKTGPYKLNFPITVFHATDRKNLSSIQYCGGLIPFPGRHAKKWKMLNLKYVYGVFKRGQAERIGRYWSKKIKDPVVLEFQIPKNSFLVDEHPPWVGMDSFKEIMYPNFVPCTSISHVYEVPIIESGSSPVSEPTPIPEPEPTTTLEPAPAPTLEPPTFKPSCMKGIMKCICG